MVDLYINNRLKGRAIKLTKAQAVIKNYRDYPYVIYKHGTLKEIKIV